MRGRHFRRFVTGLMSASMLVSLMPATPILAEDAEASKTTEPYYNFTFEADTVSDKTVSNASGEGKQQATIGGESASIAYNEERGSNVLVLPGGGVTAGYLTLPEDLICDATDGFSLSFWVNAAEDNSHYSRIFEASTNTLGAYYQGVSNSWTDPEFTIVCGGSDTADTRYDSCINTTSGTKNRLEWATTAGGGEWKYVTVSVSESAYNVYINGKSIELTDLSKDQSSVLKTFFSELDQFKYCALGQSVYTSDANAEAMFDDFRVYKKALSSEEAIALYTTEYEQEIVEDIDYGEDTTIEYDMTDSLGDMFHGSTGFLYGCSEVNVPSMDLISAISPKILVQKAADGKQHPSGDAYRLTDYLTECGVENIQVYLQDYYLEWPYEYNGIDDYKEKVESIVSKMVEGKTDEQKAAYSYVLFNEPDGIWYSNSGTKLTTFCQDWKTIYDAVKAIDPNAKTAGPNFSVFSSSAYETFFKYAAENDCLPEIITWHDLQKDKLTGFASEYSTMQKLIAKYYANSDIEPKIFINETANFEDIGVPGTLINWISIFEERNVYASLPYWGLANSMNELAATANEPNSGWWVYKWYADMQGEKVSSTTYNNAKPSSSNKGDSLSGLCSYDEDNSTVATIFGGHEGTQVISFKNLKELKAFAGSTSAHVKIYRSRYSGQQGSATPTVIMDQDVAINANKSLQITLSDCDLMDGYYAIITPAAGCADTVANTNFSEIYEAEDATLFGSATAVTRTGGSDLARSGRADVSGIYSESDGLTYTVEVPEDGVYEAKIYYSVAAPYVNATTLEVDASGQNRAIGQVCKNKLVIDGNEEDANILTLASTVKTGYYNYVTVHTNLTAGKHTFTITHYGTSQKNVNANIRVCATHDKMDLTYEGQTESLASTQLGFEELKSDNYKYDNSILGYTSCGYKTGSGKISMTVVVEEDGLYDTSLKYAASEDTALSLSKTSFDYGKDATATADVDITELKLTDATLPASNNEFQQASLGKVYLTAGANTIILDAASKLALDEIKFVKDSATTEDATITYEAESGEMAGAVSVISNDYASGNKMVDGIGGGSEDNTLTMNVYVEKAGSYKLSIYYTNDEPAPVMKKSDGSNYVHPYNTDLVERYAQIVVNGAEPETVYFRNTLSWDVIRNVVIDLNLKAGNNTIVFSNDNSYKFSELQDDYAPRFDEFEITPAYESADYVITTSRTSLYKALLKARAFSSEKYVKTSFEALTAAIATAQEFYDSGADNTEEITKQLDALNSAIDNLVDLTDLIEEIEIAEDYQGLKDNYTDISFSNLTKAIEQAKKTLAKEDASKDEVKSAVKLIKNKINALHEKYTRIDNSTGTITSSTCEGSHAERAWDGDTSTYPDLVTSSGGWDSSAAWTQIEFPEAISFTKLAFANRSGYLSRLVGGIFYGSNDGKKYTKIYTIGSSVSDGYNTVEFDQALTYKYIRYNSLSDCYLNISDIAFYTEASYDETEDVYDKEEGSKEEEADAGNTDGGSTDAGNIDGGSTDAGSTDAGNTENGNTETPVKQAECSHQNQVTLLAKAATYFDYGYTGDICCKDCGAVITKGSQIEKLTLATSKLKSVKNSKKKSLSLKWSKIKDASGYQIAYATNSKFKNATVKKVKSAKTLAKTYSKFKKNKTYYVRIRGYKTGKNEAGKSTTVYSSWSASKKIKIKK